MSGQHRNKQRASKTSARNSNNMKPLVLLTAGFILIIALLVVISQFRDQNHVRHNELPSIEGQPVMGAEDAPVTIVEFGDYLCPTCGVWDKRIFPQLYDEYIETGKAKFAFINVLFQEDSEIASLASELVFEYAPEYFWDYHSAIFTTQLESIGKWATPELFVSLAEKHVPGIDLDKFAEDLKNKASSDSLDVDYKLVQRFNIRATPTVIINGIVANSATDYQELKEIIDRELEGGSK